MLPVRKSSPVRRSTAIAIDVRVPSLGMSFAALAAGVEPESIFLSTFLGLDAGTKVILHVSLPDGRAELDGVVSSRPTSAGGIRIDLVDVDDHMKTRLEAAACPPTARVA
jgi:hypothetical protein